jgi:hypothetical protein
MGYRKNFNAIADLSECGQCLHTALKIVNIKSFLLKAIRKDLLRKLLQDTKYYPHIQTKKTSWSESASEIFQLSDRRLSAKLVPTFARRGCHVVSATDSLRPYSLFYRTETLIFYSSSSSIVLTRLNGLRSRAITSQKIWYHRKPNQNLWIYSQEL